MLARQSSVNTSQQRYFHDKQLPLSVEALLNKCSRMNSGLFLYLPCRWYIQTLEASKSKKGDATSVPHAVCLLSSFGLNNRNLCFCSANFADHSGLPLCSCLPFFFFPGIGLLCSPYHRSSTFAVIMITQVESEWRQHQRSSNSSGNKQSAVFRCSNPKVSM